eukprot:c10955_g1_i2 orf=727-1776(+)
MALTRLSPKKQGCSLKMVCKVAIAFIILLQIGSGVASAHTKKGHRKHAIKHRKSHNNDHHKNSQPHMRSDSYSSYSNIFDVLAYGAIGDGETDDTEAFQAAWQQACQVEGAIFEVPQYFTFVVRPIVFSGPCAPNMVFQIDGAIAAPENPSKWGPTKNLLQWINFSKLRSMRLQGPGFIDGKGAAWWPNTNNKGKKYGLRPTAVRFYGSYNVTVKNLKIMNSPQTHLKFDSCLEVKVSNITIHSPTNSPNTDGIHLQNTQDAEICDSYIENGDDCISIQTGSSNLNIHDVICEAGHGISLGGLGRGQTQACVTNVTVHDVVIRNSQNGVRIKTWQVNGLKGSKFQTNKP